MVASGLYHSGMLRLMQRVSRSYELRSNSARRPPRWGRVTGPKFVILCYHRIGTEGIPLFSGLPPQVFEAQMRYLRQRYRVISLEELCHELEEPQTMDQAVVVTFDDGYRDTFIHAFPILQKYRVPATIFLIVGSVETGEVPWYDRVFLTLKVLPGGQLDLELDCPRRFDLPSPAARLRAAEEIVGYLRTVPDSRRRECCAALERLVVLPKEELAERMLTWEQVRRMQREGMAFGSHTMTHPVVAQLPPAEMERELMQSRLILEQRIGSPVRNFAFPFGQLSDCGPIDGETLSRFGYQAVVTTIPGVVVPGMNRYALRRLSIGGESSLAMFALHLNRAFLHSGEEGHG